MTKSRLDFLASEAQELGLGYTMEENLHQSLIKKQEALLSGAMELKTKRLIMGLKAIEVSEATGINQGNYSNMESGKLNPQKALDWIRERFIDFVIQYEKDHIKNIEYLKSLIK